jgi:hypothetical protein
VRKLKTGKSPGPDGISAEHLKHMPSELIPYLINIINLIFMEKDVPQGVKEGVLTPVHFVPWQARVFQYKISVV